MSDSTLPQWTRLLVRLLVPVEHVEVFMGDLEEEFRRRGRSYVWLVEQLALGGWSWLRFRSERTPALLGVGPAVLSAAIALGLVEVFNTSGALQQIDRLGGAERWGGLLNLMAVGSAAFVGGWCDGNRTPALPVFVVLLVAVPVGAALLSGVPPYAPLPSVLSVGLWILSLAVSAILAWGAGRAVRRVRLGRRRVTISLLVAAVSFGGPLAAQDVVTSLTPTRPLLVETDDGALTAFVRFRGLTFEGSDTRTDGLLRTGEYVRAR